MATQRVLAVKIREAVCVFICGKINIWIAITDNIQFVHLFFNFTLAQPAVRIVKYGTPFIIRTVSE